MNLPVEEYIAELFEKLHAEMGGEKGQKFTGAIKALLAIYAIDSGLAYKLMETRVSVEDAKSILVQGIVDYRIKQLFEPLSAEDQVRLLLSVKEAKEKVLPKYKFRSDPM